MRNKKGMSHVEVLISFALFITLLTLIFVFIKPIREPSLSNILLDIAEDGLKKEATIALVTLPFNAPSAGACITFDNPLNMRTGLAEDNIFITDIEGEYLDFSAGDFLSVQNANAYKIHYSFDAEFTSSRVSDTCISLEEGDVTFSAPRVDTYLSFNKLNEIEGDYIRDYEDLRARWFFPERSGFSITIKENVESGIDIKMEKDPPQGKNVYARTITLNVLQDKEIKQVDINIRVW